MVWNIRPIRAIYTVALLTLATGWWGGWGFVVVALACSDIQVVRRH